MIKETKKKQKAHHKQYGRPQKQYGEPQKARETIKKWNPLKKMETPPKQDTQKKETPTNKYGKLVFSFWSPHWRGSMIPPRKKDT